MKRNIILLIAISIWTVGCKKEIENSAPTAYFDFTPTFGIPSTVFHFDASRCSDAETPANELQVRWDWDNSGNWTQYSTIKTADHQFATAGSYSVKLEVMDTGEMTDLISYTILVASGGKERDGTFTDPRDGKAYGYKIIGSQIWMCENLAYLPAVSPSDQGSATEKHYYVYDYEGASISEAKVQANYTTYGVLYNWPAAMNGDESSVTVPSGVPGVCPPGWHLPSDAEWTVLTDFLSGNGYGFGGRRDEIGKALASTSGWTSYPTMNSIGNNQLSNNASGFSALPAGQRRELQKGFDYAGSYAYFWSSSTDGVSGVWIRALAYNYDIVYRYSLDNAGLFSIKETGLSIRCVRN